MPDRVTEIRASVGGSGVSGRDRGCLVSLAGLPGSGKSHLAHQICAATGALVVRTDEVRRVLFPEPSYSPEESSAVYLACFAAVRALLHDRYAMVFDGTNGRRSGRRLLGAIARIERADHASVLVEAPPDVVRERITRRAAGLAPSFGSEAGVAIYERMAASEDYGGYFDLVVNSDGDIQPTIMKLAMLIRGQGQVRSMGGEA